MKPIYQILILVALVILVLIYGYKNWGWFAAPCIGCGSPRPDTNGFPASPQIGDFFTKDAVVYRYQKRDVPCTKAPCYDAMWVVFNSGDTPRMASNSNTSGRVMSGVCVCDEQAPHWLFGCRRCWDKDRVASQQNNVNSSSTSNRNSANRTLEVNKGGVYTQNGMPVNIGPDQKQMTCNDWCIEQGGTGGELEQYPSGSIYHPYYFCGCRKPTKV